MSSFYARFPTKASLVNAFFDRFFEVSGFQMRAALSGIASRAASRADRTRLLVAFMLRAYRDYRGLLRSLILHDRTHPDAGFGVRTRTYKRQVSKEFLALILDDAGPPLAPSARASVGFGLWLVIQAIEQIVLFDDPVMGAGRMSERRLVEELTSTLLRAVESSAPMKNRGPHGHSSSAVAREKEK
jgi:AcrR family transcriptional regulator